MTRLFKNLFPLFFFPLLAFCTPPIVKLQPLLLSQENLCERQVLIPALENRNISSSLVKTASGNKRIICCYGPTSWSTLWKDVSEARALLEKEGLSKTTSLRIIGAGSRGLALAIELTRSGYHVNAIVTREIYDIASWHPDHLLLVEPTYQDISLGRHPYISKEAVRLLPTYLPVKYHDQVDASREVILDFGNGLSHAGYLECMSFAIDPTKMMQELYQEIMNLRIPVELQQVRSYEELDESVLIDCAGIEEKLASPSPHEHLLFLSEDACDRPIEYLLINDQFLLYPSGLHVSSQHPEGIIYQAVIKETLPSENASPLMQFFQGETK